MAHYPDPRRIVTGHDEAGNAIFVADSQVQGEIVGEDKFNFTVLWETHQFPASNDKFEDPILNTTKSLANANGVVMRVVDFQPKTRTMFHRTESLDFGIVMDGEITCYLDNGEERAMKKGDVCVQRGTIHGWDNKSDKPVRMYFVLTAAEPVKIGDRVLGDAGFSDKDVQSGGSQS